MGWQQAARKGQDLGRRYLPDVREGPERGYEHGPLCGWVGQPGALIIQSQPSTQTHSHLSLFFTPVRVARAQNKLSNSKLKTLPERGTLTVEIVDKIQVPANSAFSHDDLIWWGSLEEVETCGK